MHSSELQAKLQVYSALAGRLVPFEPISSPQVGMYVCGPTVYDDVHLGNIRTFLSFDVICRFLRYADYEVRYVRNITDVGHLSEEQHTAEHDKVERAAKQMKMEPQELTEHYTRRFHSAMDAFNILPPNVEPRATAHIPEQLQLVARLLEKKYAYEAEGSVYFDLQSYQQDHQYGQLSGRNTEELYLQTRPLQGQKMKRHPFDFALWKKTGSTQLMQWPSPWGEGIPGWHVECSAMSNRYLGTTFDIHGGGIDLKFPHHECELAQSTATHGHAPARYWLYANMLTVRGEKMSKSAGNVLTFQNITDGTNSLLSKPYSPMVMRFFMLQTHYGSPLDISAEAVEAAEKGYLRLMNGLRLIKDMKYPLEADGAADTNQQAELVKDCGACAAAMCYDFNTPSALAALFGLLRKINALGHKKLPFHALGKTCFQDLRRTYIDYVETVLGLALPAPPSGMSLLKSLLAVYKEAKARQQYELVNDIRKQLREQGIALQDDVTGKVTWSYVE